MEKANQMSCTRAYTLLVACECSQRVASAFRARGWEAFSCDLERVARGGDPSYHIQGDVTNLINGDCYFNTQDGKEHHIETWDLIIAHPPCTYICKVGSPLMFIDGHINEDRLAKQKEAVKFFYKFIDASAHYIAVENPLPQARAKLPQPTTYVEPYEHGEPYTKKTLLWLKNLPPLLPTAIETHTKQYTRASRGKYRSRTFKGIAQAMADQWGALIENELHTTNPLEHRNTN